MSELLFEPPLRFQGLPADAWRVFAIPEREERRRAIVRAFHPSLALLGEDLLERLSPLAAAPLHAHLPRLDWPRGYQPFCTWLVVSREAHGYQAGPQLNVGVHADHVAIRLGWDTQATAFGRFEFLSRHGGVGDEMARLAAERNLRFRVYSAAPWPEGSRLVFDSPTEWAKAFDEVARRGVWFELGERRDLPGAAPWVGSQALARDACALFRALLPLYDRLAGHVEARAGGFEG
jgi:hypothetical protein